ncbi:hypothetical protein [Streptomyces seoulensis]|uniref:hypothetical protein n=1 Tax=Streptomyces seoulensis TaxID=73044 RepID=UPI001FCAEF5B|nr:hypothetical protein [Streptomyces seoulensis]BDH06701.1 hypothetical protein HEK131_39280 [Streptomyces seoulensis]
MNRMKGFSRRPLFSVDAEGYGRSHPRRQHWIQDAIDRVLTQAATEVGFERERWQTQLAGDSAFSVLGADESEPLLVDDFVRHLDSGLREVNDGREADARLRLRAAFHHGVAVPARGGFSDHGAVETARILDCKPLREALRLSPSAVLAVAVSREVFHTVIGGAYTTLRAEEFREARVRSKEFDDAVWIRVPGGDVHALGSLEGGEPPVAPAAPGVPTVPVQPAAPAQTPVRDQKAELVFEAPVHGSVIGIVNEYRA